MELKIFDKYDNEFEDLFFICEIDRLEVFHEHKEKIFFDDGKMIYIGKSNCHVFEMKAKLSGTYQVVKYSEKEVVIHKINSKISIDKKIESLNDLSGMKKISIEYETNSNITTSRIIKKLPASIILPAWYLFAVVKHIKPVNVYYKNNESRVVFVSSHEKKLSFMMPIERRK